MRHIVVYMLVGFVHLELGTRPEHGGRAGRAGLGVHMRVGHMRTADPLSFAKYTESLIHVNKTYINLTQPSIGRQFSLQCLDWWVETGRGRV